MRKNKQKCFYYFVMVLLFSLIGCSSKEAKSSIVINEKEQQVEFNLLKDSEIEDINILKSQTNNGHLITNRSLTSNETLIKDIVKTIKDGSPIKSQFDEKAKKSSIEMEVNFKNGSKETLLVLINDKDKVSVVKESGEGYRLKDDAPKVVVDFILSKERSKSN
ncbi:hypothetical protein V7024_22070 [Bacillus sp. JJ864]|uniref:hypothetical protein n=1 Tax=Bacillus sp. JJ864 TaxID=3122975 RepID=UPI002FFF674B